MNSIIRKIFLSALAIACMYVLTGCAYLKNRGNDALDIFDVGLTFSKKPHVAAYVGFNGLLGLGYSKMDGKLLGLGHRQVGWLDMRFNAAGMVFEGYEQIGYGKDVDLADPNTPKKKGVGVGMMYDGVPHTLPTFLQCPKFIHFLFIGLDLTCKIGEIPDFIMGWTTYDIEQDDVYGKDKPAPVK